MTASLWENADAPATLLRLLDERGDQRRLRLIACYFFRRIFQGPAQQLFLAERWTATPEAAQLLDLAQRLADDPESDAVQVALRGLRTQLAIDCQALARLLIRQTIHPGPNYPNGQPPSELLPRVLLVAIGSMLLLPPSPLAEVNLTADANGEIPSEEDLLRIPTHYPQSSAELRIHSLLQSNEPTVVVRHLLEGLIVTGLALLLSVDDRSGGAITIGTMLDDLRVRSPDEMGLIVQGAAETGQIGLRDLLAQWTQDAELLTQLLPGSSSPRVQALGLVFLDAALTLLVTGNLTREADLAAQRSQTDLVREFVGNPYVDSGIDPLWIRADDARVGHLAESIYQEQNWEALPILGDALEEAGCSRQDLLDALRMPQTPYRGWWLLDALRRPVEE